MSKVSDYFLLENLAARNVYHWVGKGKQLTEDASLPGFWVFAHKWQNETHIRGKNQLNREQKLLQQKVVLKIFNRSLDHWRVQSKLSGKASFFNKFIKLVSQQTYNCLRRTKCKRNKQSNLNVRRLAEPI